MELSAEEGRVLGSLVEKQLTTPQLYPLTDSALVAACNQTTSRDPVVQYDLSTVRLAVRSLREKELVRTVHRTGERSDKHQHQLDTALGLSGAEIALLAALLLRGPQTAAELRSRTERAFPFLLVDDVTHTLDQLARREPPLVVRLARQPGRKESRYAQLLVPDAEASSASPAPSDPVGPTDQPGVAELAGQVEALRDEVARLRAEVAALAARGTDDAPGPV